jgi:hypothetical protein
MAGADTFYAANYFGILAFSDLPLWNLDEDQIVKPSDFLRIEQVTVAESLPLEFEEPSFTGNALKSAAVEDSLLVLVPAERSTANAQSTVTVNAVSAIDGSAATMTFVVTLDAKPGLPVGVLNLLLEDEAPGLPADQ